MARPDDGMSREFSPELQAELLDDFYVEADEHLGLVRTQLAGLEGTIADAMPAAAAEAALEAIFRGIHTLKGISAMVGLTAAEQLAHAGEEYLRPLARGAMRLSPEGFEALLAMSRRLEEIVEAHRLKKTLPAIVDLTDRLAALNPRAPAGESGEARTASMPVARGSAPGAAAWLCTFAPSRELDRRGVNINAVRTRLGAIGTILSATPHVKPGGAIVFEFALTVREPPSDLAAWEADGITFRPAAATDEATPEENRPSMFIAPSHIVRVDLSRLDELMRIAGELVIHRSRLGERISQVARDASALREVDLAIGRSLRDLRAAITRVRLVPIAEIFTRMPLVVRDLARESGKRAQLALEGQQTEIDKYLVERLKEPLLHLVRNAFSHGIETPAERLAAGKPATATIRLRAHTAGEAVLIQVRDDGRGIDAAAIARRAADLGVAIPAHLDAPALLGVLCLSGFSTREEADRAAGRGVGMAVVRDTIRELGGSLTLETEPGRGTEFTMRLPLTLSIAEMLIAGVGSQTCAVPQGSVAEIIQISETQVRTIKQTEVVPYRDGVLPLVRLRTLFGAQGAARAQVPVLIVQSERGRAGLVVDQIYAQREVVVRPLRDPLLQVPGISCATELGDGKPVLILDAVALTQGVVRPPEPTRAAETETAAAATLA